MARILVIDDDVSVCEVVKEILELAGHDVVDTTDGRVGLQLYRDKPFDLVITDMVMPHYSGIDFILSLVQDYPDAKIIAISGGGAIEAERYLWLAKEIGAKRILSKPLSLEELLSVVKEVLE